MKDELNGTKHGHNDRNVLKHPNMFSAVFMWPPREGKKEPNRRKQNDAVRSVEGIQRRRVSSSVITEAQQSLPE